MRLIIPCMACLAESGRLSSAIQTFEFRDDGRYELLCQLGHESTTLLQQQKFEVLSEMAVHAIVDGYYREAISAFSTALERFYEFSIRVLLYAQSNADDLFQSCWKQIGRQSERQLGAFFCLWTGQFKTAPTVLTQRLVERRNEVIHRGRLPTRAEAVEFGNGVLSVIRPKITALKDFSNEAIDKVVLLHLRESTGTSVSLRLGTMNIVTTIALNSDDATHINGDVEFHVRRIERQLAAMASFRGN